MCVCVCVGGGDIDGHIPFFIKQTINECELTILDLDRAAECFRVHGDDLQDAKTRYHLIDKPTSGPSAHDLAECQNLLLQSMEIISKT